MKSPCIGICSYSEGKCLGCYRTLDEIQNWVDYSDEERDKVMERVEKEINDQFN